MKLEIAECLGRAVEAHKAGRFAEAETAYRQILSRDPNHADALNLMGVLTSSMGRLGESIVFLDRAVNLYPAFAEAHFNKGNVLRALDRTSEAVAAFERVIQLQPDRGDARLNLGALLAAMQRPNDAIEAFRAMTKACPNDARGFFNLGHCLVRQKDFPGAVAALSMAIRLEPAYVQAHLELADTYAGAGQVEKAAEHYRAAIALKPEWIDAYEHFAPTLTILNAHEELVQVYETILRLGHGEPKRTAAAWAGLGAVHGRCGDFAAAMDAYERALDVIDYQAQVLYAMAELFAQRDWLGAGCLLAGHAAAAKPDDPKFRHNLAVYELKRGNLREGWEKYQSRFSAVGWQDRRALPSYDGRALADLNLVVWPEQGLGEQILFASLLPDVIARAGKVYIETRPRLAKVFARSFPTAVVMAQERDDQPLPAPEGADCQFPLAGMAKFLRPNFAAFSRHAGYLQADPQAAAAIRARYEKRAAGRRIVGLSWRSANASYGRSKSIHLTAWEDLLRTPGVMFVNVQYGDPRAELDQVRKKLGVDIYEDPAIDPLGDLDTAFTQIAALDLVISTSNTAVHIAGALNIPCWVALPQGNGAFWYWFLNRDDSPWYPSLRLFRQKPDTALADWGSGVGGRLAEELQRWLVDASAVERSS